MIPFLMILWVQMHKEDTLLYPDAYVNISPKKPLALIANKLLKRAFDIIVSLAVIGLVFPILFPIIIIAILLDSKGPIFYFQNRSGVNRSVFKIIKFRTLSVTESDKSFTQVSKNDSRITYVGRVLRKYNLDEFPQFFNVLLGNMSLIGPRPHPLKLDDTSNQFVSHYYERLEVKPGITGWAQVNGYRGATNPERMRSRVEHDIWYIENWSFLLDIKVLFFTVINPIFGEEHAY
ncbi:MAG: UDP-glucose--undecaprenyl-phosphate glucose-1-phosphate transferase [Bacteroidia bacterium]|nr:sugar transferase [Bacteroidia bacterium]NNC84932.1 UDP-glucose--undecaprenyl-phosphate glucose-1-phosphate transferase [Bacteroidia bacterium]NNM15021.1 UDP-glucose--undecaprenyl-phosphate glucose-1-phosphate transferase [Bacteroidia bacterium]